VDKVIVRVKSIITYIKNSQPLLSFYRARASHLALGRTSATHLRSGKELNAPSPFSRDLLPSDLRVLSDWSIDGNSLRCSAGSMPTVSERMHRMDARALWGKDASSPIRRASFRFQRWKANQDSCEKQAKNSKVKTGSTCMDSGRMTRATND